MNLMLKNLDNSTTIVSAKEFALFNAPQSDFYYYNDGKIEIEITGLTPKMITKIMMDNVAGFVLQQTGDSSSNSYKVVNVLSKVASVKGSL